MPSGVRSAVAVTTIVQLDRFFLKLKFSYVVLNKDHRLPTILWWALSQYGYHEWKHSKTLSLTSRTGIFVFSEKGTPAKSEHMAATQKLSIWFSCERKTLLQYSGDILYLLFQFPYLHNTKTELSIKQDISKWKTPLIYTYKAFQTSRNFFLLRRHT